MRTAHGTYKGKAKIPKELISEVDNPDSSILPQISGTSSKSSLEDIVDAEDDGEYEDGDGWSLPEEDMCSLFENVCHALTTPATHQKPD